MKQNLTFGSAFVSVVAVAGVAFLWAVVAEMAKVITHKAAFTSTSTSPSVMKTSVLMIILGLVRIVGPMVVITVRVILILVSGSAVVGSTGWWGRSLLFHI